MSELFKIIRGYYLTGVGQEPLAYYFKLSSDNLKFESVSAGDVALTCLLYTSPSPRDRG